MTLTQERVKELFDYDPATGDLTWKVQRRGRFAKPGAKAGCVARYVTVSVDCKSYPAHRVIWLWVYGEMPVEIDHINRVKTDNRLTNLRTCDRSQNTGNVQLMSTNTTGYRGIWFAKHCGRWRAAIKINGKLTHLGYFSNPCAAALRYNEAAVQHFGEFAYLNEVSQ